MKNLLLVLIILLISSLSFPQDSLRVELLQQLKDYKKRDIKKVNLLMDYCFLLESLNAAPEEEKPFIDEALLIAKEINNEGGVAAALTLKGTYYNSISKIDSAIFCTTEAIRTFEKLNFTGAWLQANANLISIYIEIEDYENAIELCEKSLKIIEKESADIQHARIYFHTAEAYEGVRQYDKAMFYFKQSKDICEKFQYETGAIIALNSIGKILVIQGEYERGIDVLKRVLEYSSDNDLPINLASVNKNLGEAYLKVNQYSKAIHYLTKSVNQFEELKNGTALIDLYKLLSESYQKIGDSQNALDSYKKSTHISDSLFSLEKEKTINGLLIKHRATILEKDKELAESKEKIALDKAEEKTKLSVIAFVLLAIIFILLIILFNRFLLIRNQKKELKAKSDLELTSSRLDALKSQMNPHFIFNSLNSIQSLILEKDEKKSYDYVVLFSELVRSTLTYSGSEFVPIHKEIELLDKYLQLESLRLSGELDYSINYFGLDEIYVPTFIIQPFVENALIHGLFHKSGEKKLRIDFKFGDFVECTIIDNGIGRAKAGEINERRINKSSSISTNNIYSRLKLLNIKYHGDFECVIEDLMNEGEASGTKVTLKIPHIDPF